MKLVIAGTRTFSDYNYLCGVIDDFCQFNKVDEIVSGGSAGADSLAETYAIERIMPFKLFPAKWKELGRKAGPLRNIEMAEYGDVLITFWDGESRGTQHMMNCMRERNKMVICLRY
jgi:hypothetical protein